MKLRIAWLSVLAVCLTLAAVPAIAATTYYYNNGPVNGQVDAWTINFGFTVSDTFNQPSGGYMLNSIIFYAWLTPGDTITSVELQVGAAAFGNELFDGTVSLTASNCFLNNFGYNVCAESGTYSGGPVLSAGNYWLTLGNANVPSGDPVYWDENSGVGCTSPGCPSSAQENTVGTIPSEAFSNGGMLVSTTGTTPEPGTIVLFGCGVLGLAGVLRRKLNL